MAYKYKDAVTVAELNALVTNPAVYPTVTFKTKRAVLEERNAQAPGEANVAVQLPLISSCATAALSR